MSENQSLYYRPSGRIPFRGNALMLLIGTLAAFILSFIYALIGHLNPFIYVQVIVAGFFGVAMGMTIHKIGRAMKVRNRFFAGLISFVIGVLGMYFSWVWYIYMLMNWDPSTLVFSPAFTFQALQVFAEHGLWEIKNAKPTGTALYVVWLIEAAIVVFFCVQTSIADDSPFCEECNCWTEKREALSVANAETAVFRGSLESEKYGEVLAHATQEITGSDFLAIQCYSCPTCDESGYLTASRVTIVEGKEGPEAKTQSIVPLIAIPDALVKALGEISRQPKVVTSLADLESPSPEPLPPEAS